MRRVVSSLIFLFSICFIALSEENTQYVYILNKPHAKTYHITPFCKGLENAYEISNGDNYEVLKVSINDAVESGRRECKICYKDSVMTPKSVSNDNKFSDNNLYYLWNSNLIFRILLIIAILVIIAVIILPFVRKIKKDGLNKLSYKPEVTDTKTISLFLQQFGKKDALKYTTHIWAHSLDNGEYIYQNFDDFKCRYSKLLFKWKNKVEPLCPHLWGLINNFLLDDEGGRKWSKHNIKVGYNKDLKRWMDAHPGEQPLNMPLSEFSEDIRPSQIEKRSINSFRQVVDLFKKCIEFRDDNLYFSFKSIIKEYQLLFDPNNIKCLKGLTFYTDTEFVENAMRIMVDNISQHGESPKLEISCNYAEKSDHNQIIISILHVGSFSNREISDPKITGEDKNGAIATIKERLKNLCDFAVESSFKVDGKETPLHINYLVSNDSEEGIFSIPQEDCNGFKYILTFYIYNK